VADRGPFDYSGCLPAIRGASADLDVVALDFLQHMKVVGIIDGRPFSVESYPPHGPSLATKADTFAAHGWFEDAVYTSGRALLSDEGDAELLVYLWREHGPYDYSGPPRDGTSPAEHDMIRRLVAFLVEPAPGPPSSPPQFGRRDDQYRQGDLLFVRQGRLPPESVPRAGDAIGTDELTGQAHRLTGGVLYQHGATTYAVAGPAAAVIHPEYAALALPAGFYLVIRQREYRGEEKATDARD
jgi:hypothetical protein